MPKVAIALHAWSGSSDAASDNKRYLTFPAGAKIAVVEEREEGGWWAGRLDGRLGWFPSSFCRIEEEPDADASPAKPTLSQMKSEEAVPRLPRTHRAPEPERPQAAAGASLAPLKPEPSKHAAAPAAARGNSFYADFEQPLTSSAAAQPAPPPVRASSSGFFAGILGGGSSTPAPVSATSSVSSPVEPSFASMNTTESFAASVNDFVGGDQHGVSGSSALDKRLQSVKLPSRLATSAGREPATPDGRGKIGKSGGGGGGGGGGGAGGATSTTPPRPIWQSLAYIDLFADAAGGARAALLASDAAPRGMSTLGASMKLILRLLKTLGKETANAAAADAAFVSGVAAAGPLPELGAAEEGFRLGLELISLQQPQLEHAGLLQYLEQLVPMVNSLPIGGELVVPAAWDVNSMAFVLVLHRTDEGSFNVAVCNWGQGIDRHPAKLNPATGGVQRTPAVDLRGVARERLVDTGFWFILYRMLFVKEVRVSRQLHTPRHLTPTLTLTLHSLSTHTLSLSPSPPFLIIPQSSPRGPKLLYDHLLPALTDMPVMTHAASAPHHALRWHDPPLSGDVSHASLVIIALEAMMCARGFSASQAEYLCVLVRWEALQITAAELTALPSISASDAVLLRLACSHTASAAASLADGVLPFSTNHAAGLRATIEQIEGLVDKRRAMLAPAAPPEVPELSASEPLSAGAAAFPLFGRLLRSGDVEHFAGESEVPPVVLPVELSLVEDRVTTLNGMCNALRRTVQLCEVLANQMVHVRNTYCIRIALIQHLVTSVMPLPLPATHPNRKTQCFYASQSMRYETQADLLRLLSMVCRHFAACCFSIRVTRSFDAVRLVIVACLATVADAVMRITTCDVPSLLCQSYSGLAAGPGGPFGFEVGSFAVESEDLQLSAPELHTARARVLDYFAAQKALIEPTRLVFRYEQSMDFAEGRPYYYGSSAYIQPFLSSRHRAYYPSISPESHGSFWRTFPSSASSATLSSSSRCSWCLRQRPFLRSSRGCHWTPR